MSVNGDREPGILHVVRVRRVVATKRSQDWKDVFSNNVEHLLGFEVLESRPAQVFVRTLLRVFAFWKRSALISPISKGSGCRRNSILIS